MACPFFKKLAPELRATIDEYVFSSDVPIKRVLYVKPPKGHCFCESTTELDALIAVDGHIDALNARIDAINFQARHSLPSSSPCVRTGTCGSCVDSLVNVALLRTSKTVHQEAIKAFYDVKTISVDFEFIERFRKARQAPLAGSDPTLIKSLPVKFNTGGYWGESRYRRALTPETIDTGVFFAQVHTIFPLLHHVDIHTDGMPHPVLGMLRIGHNCLTSWDVRKAATDGVGSMAVETHLGFSMAIKFKSLVETWESCFDVEESPADRTQWLQCKNFAEVVKLAFRTRERLEREPQRGKVPDLVKKLAAFQREMAASSSVYENCSMGDHEFWSCVVGAVAKKLRLHF